MALIMAGFCKGYNDSLFFYKEILWFMDMLGAQPMKNGRILNVKRENLEVLV